MQFLKKVIKYAIFLVIGIGVAIVVALNVSPKLFVFFLNHAAGDEAAIKPRAYQNYREKIAIKQNVKYSSQYAQKYHGRFL